MYLVSVVVVIKIMVQSRYRNTRSLPLFALKRGLLSWLTRIKVTCLNRDSSLG